MPAKRSHTKSTSCSLLVHRCHGWLIPQLQPGVRQLLRGTTQMVVCRPPGMLCILVVHSGWDVFLLVCSLWATAAMAGRSEAVARAWLVQSHNSTSFWPHTNTYLRIVSQRIEKRRFTRELGAGLLAALPNHRDLGGVSHSIHTECSGSVTICLSQIKTNICNSVNKIRQWKAPYNRSLSRRTCRCDVGSGLT